jgi:glycosyltransferase involved in cell wall biosynthesis
MLSHSDVHGGASRAALRLHRALRSSGVDCEFLVGKRFLEEEAIVGPATQAAHRWSDARSVAALGLRLLQRTRNEGLHSYNLFPSGLAARLNRMDVDVINMHWPHRELLSIAEIGKLRAPVVWTMHDQWAFCGAEHYDDPEREGRYLEGYTRRADTPWLDIDGWVWRRKQRHWTNRPFHFVGPSVWMTNCAANSALLSSHPATTIPNCVDTELFRPRDRQDARRRLGLDADRKYLLTVAMSVDSDRRKGLQLLVPAVQQLASTRADTDMLVVGAMQSDHAPDFGLPAHYLGKIDSEEALAWVYAACDLFVIPSLQENLPNTVVEALACGIPSVGFDIGGMSDLIRDGITGGLAPAFDVKALADKMAWVLDNGAERGFSGAAREQALANHSPTEIARRYLDVFEAMCR